VSARQNIDWSDAATCAFDLVAREFVVVTADGADLKAFSPLCALLRRMRKALGLEAAFISEASAGETVVRRHDDRADGECDPLQSLFGQRLLAETAPESCGNAFDAVPVITNDGMEHGTLCFRIAGADSGKAPDRAALRSVARLIANWFEEAELSLSGFTPLAGASVMGSLSATVY
jgi:hypothetical protein